MKKSLLILAISAASAVSYANGYYCYTTGVKSNGSEVKWEFLFDTAKETQHFLEITPDYGIGCLVFAKDAKLGHDSKDFRPLLTCSMGNESKSSSAIADLGVEVLSVSHQSGAQKRQLICTKYK